MKTYKFGFSIKGLTSFLLVMMPNIIWMLAPPANDILAGNNAVYPWLDTVMRICQWVLIASLVFVSNKSGEKSPHAKPLLVAAIMCLIGYYISWVCYYMENSNPWVMVVGLAALPSMLFILICIWLRNQLAVVPAAAFAVIQIVVTFSNFK